MCDVSVCVGGGVEQYNECVSFFFVAHERNAVGIDQANANDEHTQRTLTHARLADASSSAFLAANSFGMHVRLSYASPSNSNTRLAVDNDDDIDIDVCGMPSKSFTASLMSVPMIGSVDISWDIDAKVANCLPLDDDAPSDLDDMNT